MLASVRAEPALLAPALGSLLENARSFAPPGTPIVVEATDSTVSIRDVGQVRLLRCQAGFEVENLSCIQLPGPHLKLVAAHYRQRRRRKHQVKLAPPGLHAFVGK